MTVVTADNKLQESAASLPEKRQRKNRHLDCARLETHTKGTHNLCLFFIATKNVVCMFVASLQQKMYR
jgi:hypothetical protein